MPVEASYEEVAYQFTAGILEHAGALTAVLAPTVNSYPGTALVVAAGLDGIRRNLKPGDPVNINTYEATPAQLAAASIERLPATLGEAVEEFARSDFARDALGEAVHRSFTELKRAEWQTYNTVVGQWEKDTYLRRACAR